MSLEHDLRSSLQEEAEGWSAPPELKGRILKAIPPGEGRRPQMKKWWAATILAAVLLLPTGAYAGYHYLADGIYGSAEQVVPEFGTQQGYDKLEAKLQQAKERLGSEEFTAFMTLLEEIGAYNLKIADAEGKLHPQRLSADEQAEYNRLTGELASYAERLEDGAAAEGAVPALDGDAFWAEPLAKAERSFTAEEFADFKKCVDEFRTYASGTGKTDARYTELLEQLNEYLGRLGIRIAPGS
ncbi:DUF3600 domain-containing protein [Paenibacillus tengchongensis]|uniref:DUF3600 domain-containing protein n=1 Tax=Paenibacillus tengchongensis TaxID=2608684 RepID=UPI00124DC95B|nr:DUF3600 domain-containing protein [Paenibacillus tengchongensis]